MERGFLAVCTVIESEVQSVWPPGLCRSVKREEAVIRLKCGYWSLLECTEYIRMESRLKVGDLSENASCKVSQ